MTTAARHAGARTAPVFLLLGLGLGSPVLGQKNPDFAEPPTHTIYFENDLVVNTDRYYTNGVRWTRSAPLAKNPDGTNRPELVPFWARSIHRRLNRAAAKSGEELTLFRGIGYTNIFYTPDDIETAALIVDGRPYAGWSYLSSTFMAITGTAQHTAEASLGVVGPLAFGEELQKFAHETLSPGSPEPQGWDNQLENEPAVQFFYEYRRRPDKLQWWNADGDRLRFDAGPHALASVGTVFVRGGVGFSARLGHNIPPGFPSPNQQVGPEAKPEGRFSLYVFANVDAQAVAWNTFLDGNLFSDSHSVDKKYGIVTSAVGLSFRCGRYAFTYQTLSRSKEFDLQPDRQSWGSLSVSISPRRSLPKCF